MLSKPTQSEKTNPEMSVTPAGMVTFARLLHPLNAKESMEVTFCGMSISERLVHELNAHAPMLDTLLGSMTDCSL